MNIEIYNKADRLVEHYVAYRNIFLNGFIPIVEKYCSKEENRFRVEHINTDIDNNSITIRIIGQTISLHFAMDTSDPPSAFVLGRLFIDTGEPPLTSIVIKLSQNFVRIIDIILFDINGNVVNEPNITLLNEEGFEYLIVRIINELE